jgi:hypothetical protein
MGTIKNAKDIMSYQPCSIAPHDCQRCSFSRKNVDGLRCSKGSFFVSPVATCKRWLAVEHVQKVQSV